MSKHTHTHTRGCIYIYMDGYNIMDIIFLSANGYNNFFKMNSIIC